MPNGLLFEISKFGGIGSGNIGHGGRPGTVGGSGAVMNPALKAVTEARQRLAVARTPIEQQEASALLRSALAAAARAGVV